MSHFPKLDIFVTDLRGIEVNATPLQSLNFAVPYLIHVTLFK